MGGKLSLRVLFNAAECSRLDSNPGSLSCLNSYYVYQILKIIINTRSISNRFGSSLERKKISIEVESREMS